MPAPAIAAVPVMFDARAVLSEAWATFGICARTCFLDSSAILTRICNGSFTKFSPLGPRSSTSFAFTLIPNDASFISVARLATMLLACPAFNAPEDTAVTNWLIS